MQQLAEDNIELKPPKNIETKRKLKNHKTITHQKYPTQQDNNNYPYQKQRNKQHYSHTLNSSTYE